METRPAERIPQFPFTLIKLLACKGAVPTSKGAGTKRSKRFTLIELLVVIAIIAILASMLLPALAKARAIAINVDCINRIKQLAMGLNMYTSEFDDQLPPRSNSWVHWAGTGTPFRPMDADERYINPYIGGPYAPGDDVPLAQCPGDQAMYEKWGASYVFNRWMVRDDWTLHTIKAPSKFIIFSDMGGLTLVSNSIDSMTDEQYFHRGVGINRFSFAFTDGHAISIQVSPGLATTSDYVFNNDIE